MLLTKPRQERQNWLARFAPSFAISPSLSLSITSPNITLRSFVSCNKTTPCLCSSRTIFPLRQGILQPSRGDHEDIAKDFAYGTPAAKHLRALASTTRHHARRPVKIPANGGVARSLSTQVCLSASVPLYLSWSAQLGGCRRCTRLYSASQVWRILLVYYFSESPRRRNDSSSDVLLRPELPGVGAATNL
jgi:hypothetical protein